MVGFLYGIAVGLVAAFTLSLPRDDSELMRWLVVASALVLAVAVLAHWSAVQRAKGRRWRRTW